MRTLMMAAVALCLGVSPALAEEFTVATFNAEFLIRDRIHVREGLPLTLSADQRAEWTPARREAAFSAAVGRVALVIAATGADVLVLTEVGGEADVNSLNARLATLGAGYPYVAVCECTDGATQQHVAILSKVPLSGVTRSLAGREHYLTELDDEDSEEDTGLSKAMKVELSFGGRSITVYGIHLVSERGGHEGDAQRLAQASIVRRHYLRDIEQGRHVIVAGDLNDKRGDPTIQRIRGLDDIGPDLIQTGHVRYFAPDQLGERWTYAYQGERNQIDHILLSDSIAEHARRGGIRARVARVTDPQVSDHSPLIVTIDFRP